MTRRRRPLALLGIALLLGVFGLALVIGSPTEPGAVAYAIPIALIALALGPAAGAVAGLLATVLYAYAGEVHDATLGLGHISYRAVTLVFLGAVVGLLAARAARAATELRESESRLAEAQRIAHVGSWEWDVRADRITWSDELYRIWGVEAGAFSPTYASYLELLPEDERAVADAAVQQAFATKGPFAFRHRLVRPDGEVRVIDSAGRVFTDGTGEVVRMAGVAHDVTERVAAEEAAREATGQLALQRELRARAVELNDAVVQGLALSRYQLSGGDPAAAAATVQATLARAKELVADLIGEVELEAGALRRERAADAVD
ncbi:MAG TPA: PAS domain-containing protein [Gaiellaceae bacterium]|nr:PAS domain-containing protein [Gaiellaceae bacterium]